jgi:hypothetical protein
MKLQCHIFDPTRYSHYQEMNIYTYARLHIIIIHKHVSVTFVTIFSMS